MIGHREALDEIAEIRARIAATTTFRGFGPLALAATAAVALLTATAQTLLDTPAEPTLGYFAAWIATAVVCCAIVALEAVGRARRHHGPLATAMILQAVQQFLPCGAAGAAIAAIVGRYSPDSAWLLPGLWQVLVGLGIFAAAPSLPRGTPLAAAWYFLAGCTVLVVAAGSQAVSPWMMGVPFAVGQLGLAVVLARAARDA